MASCRSIAWGVVPLVIGYAAGAEPLVPAEAETKRSTNAAEPAQRMDKIEVRSSAQSYDSRLDDTVTRIVVTAEEIAKFGDVQLADVLKRQPGITVIDGAIRMRGLGNGYTQILLNGERLPPGFSLDTLAPNMVERIEILRAAMAEYSTQSIAGTVNIVLKKTVTVAQRDLNVGVRTGHGYRSLPANFTVSDKDNRFSYSLNGAITPNFVRAPTRTEEFGANANGLQNLHRTATQQFEGIPTFASLAPRFNWNIVNGDTVTSQSFIQYIRDRRHIEEAYTLLFGAPPQYASQTTQNHNRNVVARSDLSWLHQLGDGAKIELKVGLTFADRGEDLLREGYDVSGAHTLDSLVSTEARDNGLSMTGKWSTPYFEGHALVAGWDGSYRQRHESRNQHDNPLPGIVPVTSDEQFNAEVARLALYLQDEWNITPALSIYAGVRWERVDTTSDGNTFARIVNRARVTSPLFQTLYKFPDRKGEQVRLALTRTYKAPDTASLIPRPITTLNNSPLTPDAVGNPNLKPELATGLDAAYEIFGENGSMLSIAGTIRRISDVSRPSLQLFGGRWVSMPVSDGNAQTKSLEFDTKFALKKFYPLAPAIDMRINLNRNWSTLNSVPGPFNRLAVQTPFSGTFGIDFKTKGGELAAGSSFTFRSGGTVRTAVDLSRYVSPRREWDFYSLWKFNASRQVRLSLTNLLRQDNYQDQSYFDQTGTLRRTYTNPSSINVQVMLELKL